MGVRYRSYPLFVSARDRQVAKGLTIQIIDLETIRILALVLDRNFNELAILSLNLKRRVLLYLLDWVCQSSTLGSGELTDLRILLREPTEQCGNTLIISKCSNREIQRLAIFA
jgi:hypothetical protein